MPMTAREYFDGVRDAVRRRREAELFVEFDGDDWRPPRAPGVGVGDPTANAAVYRADVLAERLDEARREIESCEEVIGGALELIAGIGAALGGRGAPYADVLELYYIDLMTWGDVANELGCSDRYCRMLRNVALDWVDAVGLPRARGGEGIAWL